MQRSLHTLLRIQPFIRSLAVGQSGCRWVHVSSVMLGPGKTPAKAVSVTPAVAAKVATKSSSSAPTKAVKKGKAAPAASTKTKAAPIKVKAASKTKVAAPKKAVKKPVKENIRKGLKTGSSIYFKENYQAVKAAHPDKQVTEIFKIITGQYNALAPDKKAQYVARANEHNAPIQQERLKERLANKKAPSTYAIFMKESYPKIKAQDVKASVLDISKKIAELWKNTSKEEKDSYKLKHIALKGEKMAKQAKV